MSKRNYCMTYDKPAEVWNDAVPMGNGRLGAMVYGNTGAERIQLNEDSLWYGGPMDRNNRASKAKLDQIRKHVFAGEIREAETLIAQYLCGSPTSMRMYEPLGELNIALNRHTPFVHGWMPDSVDMEDYSSSLDLMTGVHTIAHKEKGVAYKREMFISYPAQVMCIKLTSDKPGAINLDILLNRNRISDERIPDNRRPGFFRRGGSWPGLLLDDIHTVGGATLMFKGNSAGTLFCCAVRAVSDGAVEDPYSQLFVRGAGEVTLYLAATTSNRESDPEAAVMSILDAAARVGYESLKAEHIADFEALMRRCVIDLGPGPDLPLDQRIELARDGASDPDLAVTYFTFGRYLMVSGGRENSAALNLQGIWSHDFIPPWDSKYTININTQMNYWPAETTGLGDIHQSLFNLVEAMIPNGRETAKIMYGCRGTMCHHNTDFYGDTAPQDVFMASTQWVIGGAWLALHAWDHYRFTLDKAFLAKWYPILREHALFFLDFLVDDGDGYLVTNPSISPENRYVMDDGFDTPICTAPTMDNQVIRTLFGACVEAAAILGLGDSDELTAQFAAAKDRLPKNAIGSKGQLLEWREEVKEMTPGMGHISHLWGSYPGDEINWKDTPELLAAVGRSLELRCEHGAGRGGWPLAWFINEYARLGDAQKTGDAISRMTSNSRSRVFFGSGRVFQIDGLLGATAGIAEALLQSHTGVVELLPALPPEWKDGSAKGLRARGGHCVDMEWKDGALTGAVITAGEGELEIRGAARVVSCDGAKVETRATEHGFTFERQPGKVYHIGA
ncbi:MAG: glycoside hydrolase family 95 protein [Oscillospiraceae bacterium]|nr:glycoside hydrolase family 95 protein [Oscillospiraceae bacterium]